MEEIIGITKEGDNLYLIDSNVLFDAYSPMEALPYDVWSNVATDEGWVVDTILNENKVRSFLHGKNNVYRYATTCENLYFVGENIDLKLQYKQTHYSPNAEYELIDTIGSENIYKFCENP